MCKDIEDGNGVINMKKSIKFYDTNELLHSLDDIEGEFYLSSVTLQELEHIKTSRNKDEDVRFGARRVTRFLRENEDKYTCVPVEKKHHKLLSKLGIEEDPDNLIMACAKLLEKEYEVTFYTDDICCYNLGKNVFKLNCKGIKHDKKVERYSGYKEIIMSDEELASFYENENKEEYNLLINEYLIVKNTLNQPIDSWKMTKDGLVNVETQRFKKVFKNEFKDQILGSITPKDFYQNCLMESLKNNKITLVSGKAGSGKSYLCVNYMLDRLQKGLIDKVIIFVNPVKVRGAKELGFYKGSKLEKLLDESIGSFLRSKLGGEEAVLSMIGRGQLELLPISDIRGYDTTDMKAIVYITEAQNMSVDIAKLSIQRVGEDCQLILDGDFDTQVDNPLYQVNNGMKRISEVFRGNEVYGEVELPICYRSEIAKIADKM